MKFFKVAFEQQSLAYNTFENNGALTYCSEGLFDWFKKQKSENKPQDTSSNNQDTSSNKKEEKPTVEQFEEELKTATGFTVHLDCDTLQNQIKFLEAYKSKFIPFLYKDIERIKNCFEFIKNKKRAFVDHIDELVDISFPNKMPGYNASKNACVLSEIIIPIDTTKEKLKKKQPDFDFYDGLDNTYPDVNDKAEQEKIVKLHMYNTWIYEFSHIDIVHKRNKDQANLTLSLDDPLAKKYIELSLHICKELIEVKQALKHLRDTGDHAEEALELEEYGDGDEFGVGEMFVHGLYLMEEAWYAFQHRFLHNCKLTKTDIATEALISNFENQSAISFSNEGIVENFASFVQRAISSEEGLRKAIQGLQGKKVIPVTNIEYAEKYSGLKILNTDKVTGDHILKYLKKVHSDFDYNTRLIDDLFDFLLKVMQHNSTSAEQHERNMTAISKEIDTIEEDIATLKRLNKEGENRKHFSISTCDQNDFDSIVQIMESIIKKNSDDIRKLKDYQKQIVEWHMVGMVPKDNNRDGIISLGYLSIRTTIEYLETFKIFEKKFLFSLTKYLQACTK